MNPSIYLAIFFIADHNPIENRVMIKDTLKFKDNLLEKNNYFIIKS